MDIGMSTADALPLTGVAVENAVASANCATQSRIAKFVKFSLCRFLISIQLVANFVTQCPTARSFSF